MTQPPDPAPRSAILTDKEHARAIVRYGSGRAMPGEAGDDLMAETFRLLRADRAALKARCKELEGLLEGCKADNKNLRACLQDGISLIEQAHGETQRNAIALRSQMHAYLCRFQGNAQSP